MALFDLCKELRNWFETEIHVNEFVIENNELKLDFLQEGQYFRVTGSVFNDDVYQYPATMKKDETFHGAIWAMAIPSSVVALSAEIDEWRWKYEAVDSVAMSPLTSESFGGYSYAKNSSTGESGGAGGVRWQDVFRSRLNNWRKI